MSAHSLLNLEGCFAVAGLLLLVFRSRTDAPPQFKTSLNFWALVIPLIAVAAFWRATHFYFLSDDFLLINHARSVLSRLPVLFTTPGGDGFYRPIGYAIYGLISTWAAFDPARWHWVGTLIHAINTMLVFLLAAKMELSRAVAWTAAALFAVHGAHPENVVWMAGDFDLFATFFVLVAAIEFLRGEDGLAMVAMTLGILCKESAYAFPLLGIVLARWQHRRIRTVFPYFIAAFALVLIRLWLFQGAGGYGGGLHVLSAGNALLVRLWAVLFFPINWTTPAVWILLGMTATYAWVFTAKVQLDRLLVLIAFVFAAALPPIQQLLIGADLQKSRLLYLPSVGFCLLIAVLAEQRRGAVVPLLALNVLALWHNLNAWEYAAAKAKTACATAAQCREPVVTGLPGSIRGVYVFANGFPECVAIQNRKPTSEACSFTWDAKTDTLVQTR